MICDDADLLLAAHAAGALDPVEEPALADHLRECATCRATGSAYLATAALLPLALDPMEPPPRLRSRILAVVYSEAAGHSARADLRTRLRRAWRAVPAARPLTALGAAAAAAAIALAAWSFAVPHGSAALTARACASSDASVCGDLRVDVAAGSGVLVVHGLTPPRLAGGGAGAYEVWLLTASGAQPGAFLDQTPDGSAWTAAMQGSMGGVRAVAVTTEPPGGSAQPTGAQLLHIDLPGSG